MKGLQKSSLVLLSIVALAINPSIRAGYECEEEANVRVIKTDRRSRRAELHRVTGGNYKVIKSSKKSSKEIGVLWKRVDENGKIYVLLEKKHERGGKEGQADVWSYETVTAVPEGAKLIGSNDNLKLYVKKMKATDKEGIKKDRAWVTKEQFHEAALKHNENDEDENIAIYPEGGSDKPMFIDSALLDIVGKNIETKNALFPIQGME